MEQYVIDGQKVIMNKPTAEQRVEKCSVEHNDVWCVDIVMSTGEGIPRETESRTTVYKRVAGQGYDLKLKASRYLAKEIDSRFPVFPFTLRSFDERQARLGIKEILDRGLLDEYPVLAEKPGDFIAQFKTTVFVLPTQTIPAFTPAVPDYVKSEYTCEDALVKEVRASSLGKPKPKKAKKAKKPAEKPAEEQK